MPNSQIEFDDRTIMKVKNKQGVYNQLKITENPDPFIRELGKQLKPILMRQIELVFKEYVRKHKGMTNKDEDKYWKQFEPIMKKYL